MKDNINDALLVQWEETYKKGLLTFWMMLVLSGRKAYPYEMRDAILALSHESVSADDNSIYRALNRLAASGLVTSEIQPSETGPSRRYFTLTDRGLALLRRFISRNILIFQDPVVAGSIKKVISTGNTKKG
jgi:PadR family transcriptional regulator PadR